MISSPKLYIFNGLLIVLVVVVVAVVMLPETLRGKHPLIILTADHSSYVYEFGALDPRPKELRQTFEIRNDFPHPIRIVGVKSSCGCAKTEINSFDILPFESTLLSVDISLANKRGAFREMVLLEFDSRNPVKPCVIYITGMVGAS